MSVSPAELAGAAETVDAPVPEPTSAGPSALLESTEVLITEQQVLFSTAAARGVRRDPTRSRIGGVLRRIFATDADSSRPRAHDVPRRYGFLESSLMAREMDRL